MLTVTISSVIESVGVFYACARICEEPPPPAHAINRGIAIEGIGSLISGAIGSGGATTSYSQNVGAIGFTKVCKVPDVTSQKKMTREERLLPKIM